MQATNGTHRLNGRHHGDVKEARPPQSQAAEQAVVGCMLRDNDCIGDVCQIVGADDFCGYAHQVVFTAITRLWDAGRLADRVTVLQELADTGMAAKLGEPNRVALLVVALWGAAATPAGVENYARIVREKAVLRQLRAAAGGILQNTQEAEAPDEDWAGPSGRADEALEQAEQAILAVAEGHTVGQTVPLRTALSGALSWIDRRAMKPTADGVLSGFIDLDALTAGFHDSELCLIAARPSTGKTTLGQNIARNVAGAGQGVLFVSLEQSQTELALRWACAEARVDSQLARKGMLGRENVQRIQTASDTLERLPIFVDDSPGQTVLRIAANARRMRRRHDIRLVVIDYLQLIEAENRRASEYERLSEISRRLKLLARELHVPLVALAQLNREVDKRNVERPKMADLRGSGNLEQDADTIMMLWCPRADDAVVEVIVAKQRNGPVGEVPLTLLKQFTRFENCAQGWAAPM